MKKRPHIARKRKSRKYSSQNKFTRSWLDSVELEGIVLMDSANACGCAKPPSPYGCSDVCCAAYAAGYTKANSYKPVSVSQGDLAFASYWAGHAQDADICCWSMSGPSSFASCN